MSEKDISIMNIDSVNEGRMRTFVGPSTDFYLNKWKSAKDIKKSAGWNWASAFLSLFWLGYRKMYFELSMLAGIFLVLDVVEWWLHKDIGKFFGIFLFIVMGKSGNKMYFDHMQKKLSALNLDQVDSDKQNEVIAAAGGTSWKGVGLSFLSASVTFIVMFVLYSIRM